jgi:hypothetical protein
MSAAVQLNKLVAFKLTLHMLPNGHEGGESGVLIAVLDGLRYTPLS